MTTSMDRRRRSLDDRGSLAHHQSRGTCARYIVL